MNATGRWRKEYNRKLFAKKPWLRSYFKAKVRCSPKGCYTPKGITFHMTQDQFKYLWFRDKAYLMKKPSIDRKDTTGNYVIRNCRFIEFFENAKRPKNLGWILHGKCSGCGNTKNHHEALGFCHKCYMKIYHFLHPKKHKKATPSL